MKNSFMSKSWRCRISVFFALCLFILSPIVAQNEISDTLGIRLNPETPNVLLGKQDPLTRVQSISTVSGDRLLHRPVFQMEQFLDGTLPGLYVNLSQGYPTERGGLNMRQRSLLIVVDGIPRADANIPASQIESVSLIKDAVGLAAWGMSSGDGVLYIKTKRGDKSKLRIDLTAQYATAQQIYRPNFLNAYEYGTLLNQALINDGGSAIYSEADLIKYRDGSSPYTHPNVNWYDVLMQNSAPIQQYNLNMSGGTSVARYFIDINVYDQQGFLKQDRSINAYNTSESFNKYSLRTNVDVNLTATTLLQVNVFGQMFKENTPGNTMMGSIYRDLHTVPNNAYAITNPNGTYGGNQKYTKNLYGQIIESGYIQYPKTDFNFDIALEHYFTGALKGLYVRGMYSYNSSYRESLKRTKGYETWAYTPAVLDAEGNIIAEEKYEKLTSAAAPSRTTEYQRQYRLQYMDASLGYDFSTGEHSLNTKLTYWTNEFTLMATNLPMYKYGFNLHSEYNFDKRYMAEISISRMHFNYLSPSKSWGFFPTIGLGWNIDREDFFDLNAIDALKLRTTYGLSGNDQTGSFFRTANVSSMSNYYYPYIRRYKSGGTVNIGGYNDGKTTLIEDGIAYDPEYEKSRRFTLALDALFLDRSLGATVEFFHNYHYDILRKSDAKDYNSMHGGAALENIGVYRQTGIELDINYAKQFGDFNLEANLQTTFYRRILLENGEPTYPESYMQRVGNIYNRTFGYVAEGIFQNQAEIDEYMYPSDGSQGIMMDGYIPKPGDVRYKDLNGDHNIDDLDIQAIGTKAPRIEYGFYLKIAWKGLALQTQWTGLANSESIIGGDDADRINMPFKLNSYGAYGQAWKEHLDSWSENNPNASYPRVSAAGNSYNERRSTLWLKKTDYLRLKNVELSYSLPKSWMTPIHLSGIKIFANAYNLLTFTPLKDRDPELVNYMSGSTGIVPNTKAWNVGLNVQF